MPLPSIEKNWVVFDTCSLSKIMLLEDATPIMSSILNKINKFTPVITPLIRFEFLRLAKSKAELEKFKFYLASEYVEIDLKSDNDRFDLYQLSAEVACIYRYVKKDHYKHIGLADFIHGGLLRRYPKNLFLLTFDINDFPEPIFQILHHESIKVSKSIEVWALLKFNKEEFGNFYERFKMDT